jgi:hypothetical protein
VRDLKGWLWIYDFDKQLHEPVDKVDIKDLPQRYAALNFLFPDDPKPIFGNDLEEASRETADQIADLYQRLVTRKIPRDVVQRFVLQLIVAMFAEDIDLLPANTVTRIVDDCVSAGQSSFDLFGGLFTQMNTKELAKGGRFEGVPYFNGGLFQKIDPFELKRDELLVIGGPKGAASKNWSKVDPVIFGSIFRHSMDAEKRHAYGAHYTHEADIQRIVAPTIVRPWRELIDAAKTVKELSALRVQLTKFRVLDPACGSGNFLYVSRLRGNDGRLGTGLAGVGWLPQAISICSFRPSAVAARRSVLSVTDLFSGSSRRSSWRRSVFILAAMVVLVMPFAFMPSAICQASTRLMATSSASASMPCVSRKLSKLSLLIRPFDFVTAFFAIMQSPSFAFAPTQHPLTVFFVFS